MLAPYPFIDGSQMSQSPHMVKDSVSGADYFLRGFSLIRQPGIRTFVLIPLLVNFVLFAGAFYALLLQKVEQILTGEAVSDTGMLDVVKDVPRTFSREWTKLKYYLPKAIGCLILFLIPVVGQTLAPVLWFLFSAWMMAIQYIDYPFDNHKINFITMRDALKQRRGKCLSFGALVTLFSAIPVVNLFVMPVAICGATAMWVDQYRNEQLRR